MLALLAVTGCEREPFPEYGTATEALYRERCGGCHRPFHPAMLKPKMWETMVERMQIEMRRRGVALSDDERREILDYLSRNASKR
jgi:mono/diheme cytochrome c family protein